MGHYRDPGAEVPASVVARSHWSAGIRIHIMLDRDPSLPLPWSGCLAGSLVGSPTSLSCSVGGLVNSPTSLGCSTVFDRCGGPIGFGGLSPGGPLDLHVEPLGRWVGRLVGHLLEASGLWASLGTLFSGTPQILTSVYIEFNN
jgi:hypothetical protein